MKAWVLLRQRGEGDATPIAVYTTYEALVDRVERIAQVNSQYPMRAHAYGGRPPMSWTVGPEHDEGFFGHKPVNLSAHATTFHEPSMVDR